MKTPSLENLILKPFNLTYRSYFLSIVYHKATRIAYGYSNSKSSYVSCFNFMKFLLRHFSAFKIHVSYIFRYSSITWFWCYHGSAIISPQFMSTNIFSLLPLYNLYIFFFDFVQFDIKLNYLFLNIPAFERAIETQKCSDFGGNGTN